MSDWESEQLVGIETFDKPDPRPDRLLAAIAFGRGKLLYWQGAGVEAEIETLGEDDLIEYGIDDVPEYQGVYVWEGKLFCDKDYYGEYDQYLSGNWRQVTKEEWQAYLNDEWVWEPFLPEPQIELAVENKDATMAQDETTKKETIND